MHLTKSQITNLITQDPRTLLEFYRQSRPALKRYFQTRVSNHHDQEELVHDTILSILDSLPQFKFKSKFSTWMYSIAHHELVDYYRRQKIKAIVFSKLPFLKHVVDKALGPQLSLEEVEVKQKIFKSLKNLSEGYSQILRLRYMEGLSVTTIAKKLNITYKAAESRLTRARLAFQKEYSD